MLLHESILMGTILARDNRPKSLLEMALIGSEARHLTIEASIRGFLEKWPWVAMGKIQAPEWSARKGIMDNPANLMGRIWAEEVLPGKVTLEKFLDWVRDLETIRELEQA